MKTEITIEAFSSTTQITLNGDMRLIEKIVEAIKKIAVEYSQYAKVE